MRKCELYTKLNTYLELNFKSKNTKKVYINCFWKFNEGKSNISRLTKNDIEVFLIGFKNTYSPQYYNQMVSMLKILYIKVLNSPRKVQHINMMKTKDSLFQVLTEDEVRDMITSLKNIKHKCIILLMYSGALRISEVQKIKLKDIDSTNERILLRDTKGGKDRFVPVSENIIELLRRYYKEYKPYEYLFEGVNRGEKYSQTSIRNIIKKKLQSKTSKRLFPHLFRHSLITHLIDNGENQTKIQVLVGHKSPQSTLKYYHLSNNNINIKIPQVYTC